MNYSEKTDLLIPALFKARKAMSSGAKKNTANNHLKSRYANLESFIASTRPCLEANELMLSQAWVEGPNLNYVYLKTEIMHISGQSVNVLSPFPITKNDAHGVGSAITYARRYAMAALFNIAQADDDGNATVKTSTDVAKAIKGASTLEEVKKIVDAAKKYFEKDVTAMRVINSAASDRNSEIITGGAGFTPADRKEAPNPEPEEIVTLEPQQPEDIANF